jgi:alpha-tubulin suppressor-like RCC1 family protein
VVRPILFSVQVDGEKECRVKLIQAKKYSLALTDSGDMYIWGLRPNFGLPKLVKSEEKYEVEVIDIRVSSESVYGLAAEGTLYSWGVKGGDVRGGSFVCKKEKVVANGRAVLDFSSGDNYLLVLGDIVKQIPYSSVPPSLLTCYDEL